MQRREESERWSARGGPAPVAAGRRRSPPRRPLWRVAEPTTTLTDFALAALAAVLGVLLLGRASTGGAAVLLWGAGFLTTAASALTGGAVHGFEPWLSPGGRRARWRATLVLIGLSNALLLSAVVVAELGGAARVALLAAAAGKLALYLVRLRKREDFALAAVDSGVALLGVLALELLALAGGGAPRAGWIVAGVLLSLAGAAAQLRGWSLHRHFNHNDLFHVVQMGAAYLLYRGGLLL